LLPDAVALQPELVARSLLVLLEEPMLVEAQRLRVGGSIGVVFYPEHGHDPDTLLRRADVAMYVAKRARSGVVRYDPAQDEHTPERLALAGELREAIEQDQLVLVYQPQVELGSEQIIGVEALVRWLHPRRGLIPPSEFIPMAGYTGLLEPLTRCVLRIALRQCRAWLDQGRELRIAVNVSAHDLNESFPDRVEQLLRAHKVPARLLQLEITEDAMMADPQRAQAALLQLHSLGVSISIDDFGTGYSSLAYLAQLPIDELKIDRTFVMGMQQSRRQAVIVRSTIGLGHDLGLQVIAEGVEDEATRDQLEQYGCDAFQGYFASRPVAADVLEEWFSDRWPASALPELRAA
jgi:EAL domain-containing protein (putative c-di-GMP-specific phosphodiesterase class I)